MEVNKIQGIVFKLYFTEEEKQGPDFYSMTVIAKSAEEAILKARVINPDKTVSSIFSELSVGRGPLKPDDIYY